jgi:hypothetical protein
MLHACVERFDVMGGRGNILSWDGEVNQSYEGIFIEYNILYIPNEYIFFPLKFLCLFL